MVHPIPIDYRVPPLLIVHAPHPDMQAQPVIEGIGDAHQLSAGLPVGVDEPLLAKRLGEFFSMAQRFTRAHHPLEHALKQMVLELNGWLTRDVVAGDVIPRVLGRMKAEKRRRSLWHPTHELLDGCRQALDGRWALRPRVCPVAACPRRDRSKGSPWRWRARHPRGHARPSGNPGTAHIMAKRCRRPYDGHDGSPRRAA
jgi:hypothetical protein